MLKDAYMQRLDCQFTSKYFKNINSDVCNRLELVKWIPRDPNVADLSIFFLLP